MSPVRLDHVAILVRDLQPALRHPGWRSFPIGPAEEFPAEGTREVYIGEKTNHCARVLLMQPIGPGPYQTALERRGPGLHHLALSVSDVACFASGLSRSGWYLHPGSLAWLRDGKAAWLVRSDACVAIELIEKKNPKERVPVVSKIEVPPGPSKPDLLRALGVREVATSLDHRSWLTVGGMRFDVATTTAAAP